MSNAARGTNLFETDVNLQNLLERRAPGLLERHEPRLAEFGAWAGGPLERQAEYTDRFAPPRLEAYGPDGERQGRVVFNPDYVACHAEAYRLGAVGLPYTPEGAGSHLPCFAMGYMLSQADISIHCPVTMTGAVAYVLDRLAPDPVKAKYLPELIRMDGKALSGGTWVTELHGGSDVGASTSRAEARADGFRLHGVKWFTSNAGSGLALATARPAESGLGGAEPGGKRLGCYLVPSHLDDGTPNHYRPRRLKEKAGTRGLATAELDLLGALAVEVAPPPDGLRTMMAALEYSRIHNAVGSAGLHRRAFIESLAWAEDRHAFGSPIIRYPMVRDQLLDMQMQLEASCALAFESALAFDSCLLEEGGEDWLRVATALAKYRTAEQAVRACREAVEIVGGNGYTEEFPTARLYRDCLVVAVWEGPANIQALELLRLVAGKRPGDQSFLARVGAVLADLPPGLGDTAEILEGALEECRQALSYVRRNPLEGSRHGRRLLDLMSDTLASALLCEEATADLKLGDRRKWLLAQRFVRKVLGRYDPVGIFTDPAMDAFDAVIDYQGID